MCAHFGDGDFLTELIYMANDHMQPARSGQVRTGTGRNRQGQNMKYSNYAFS